MARFVSRQAKLQPKAWLQYIFAALLCCNAVAAAPTEAPPETPPETQEPPLPSLDELLATDAGVDYDQSKRCLPVHKFDEVKALDEHHIVFEMQGNKFYLVQLERRCPGLRPQNAVVYEHRSSRLCQLDRVRGLGVTGGASPSCQLGRFQPVSEEQIALLEEALEQRAAHGKHRGKALKSDAPAAAQAVEKNSPQ